MSDRRSENGFSLIEILVAMGITGFVIAGVANLFTRAMEEGRLSRDDTRMTLLASRKIEALRSMSWTNSASPPADWTDSGGGWHPSATGSYKTLAVGGEPVYEFRWKIDLPADYSPFGRRITMYVWRSGLPHRYVKLVQVHGCGGCK